MKRLVILAIALVVLLGVWALQRQHQKSIIASDPVDTWTVDPNRVTTLEIRKADGENVELVRAAGTWRLVQPIQYAANEQIVSQSLRVLEALELEDIVSTNPANQSRYEVDSTGTHVVVKAGEETLLSAIVGKNSPDFSHTYVRRVDGTDVYRAVGMLSYNFNKKIDEWRDKTILDVDQQTISRVMLEFPKDKASATLVHADSLWTVQAGSGDAQTADSLSVANLLRTAATLRTVNFATEDEKAELDFEQPDFKLTLETDSATQVVRFVEGESNKYFAVLEGNETVFQLFKNSLTNVLKKAEDLRPTES